MLKFDGKEYAINSVEIKAGKAHFGICPIGGCFVIATLVLEQFNEEVIRGYEKIEDGIYSIKSQAQLNAALDESTYDEHGYNEYGYDREGYDENGYNCAGYDRNGRSKI